MKRAKGSILVHVGEYQIDRTTWFDIRLCDGGTVISLCDSGHNRRFSVIADGRKVIFREIADLVPKPPKS